MTYKITEIDGQTGEVVERNATSKEIKERESDLIAWAELQAEAQAQATAKALLLEKLGITEDEAKLLLS